MNADIFAERRRHAQELMRKGGIDLLVIGPSASFRYFVGCNALTTMRFIAFLLTATGEAAILTPKIQEPIYARQEIPLISWDDTQSPYKVMEGIVKKTGVRTIAVNDELWSTFFIGIRDQFPNSPMVAGQSIAGELRLRKDSSELALLRAASERIDAVWDEFRKTTTRLSGETELAVRSHVDSLMRKHGFEEVAWVDIGAGPNGASPLHSGGEYIIQEGDPVVMDFAGTYKGYFADICRVAVAGKPSPDYLKIYDVCLEAQEAAFRAVAPGVPCQEIDRAGRKVITAHGLGEHFIHRLGHGLGLAGHEPPYIIEGNTQPIEVGMVFSDEPGIYIPNRWGVRIEDIIVATPNGGERINHTTKELVQFAS
jgi:Xaa-Pro aminopeptidase